MLIKAVESVDQYILVISAHGVPPFDGNNYATCRPDLPKACPFTTVLISLKDIQDRLSKTLEGNPNLPKCVFYDCCFSGCENGFSQVVPGIRSTVQFPWSFDIDAYGFVGFLTLVDDLFCFLTSHYLNVCPFHR